MATMETERGLRNTAMKNVNCPICGGSVLNEPQLAGQVVACPSCKKPFQMPSSSADARFAFEQHAPTGQAAALGVALPSAGGEPWCYGFLEKYALTFLWIGVTVVGLLGLGTVVSLLVALGHSGAGLYTILALIFTLLVLVLLVLGFVFGAALILLAVDAGRNLREIRRHTPSRSP
jgi:hypothetical protein